MADVSKNYFMVESLSVLPLLGLHYFGFQAKGFGVAALVSEVATQIFGEKEFSSERLLKKAALLSLGYLAVKEKSIDFNGLEASFAGLFLIACQNNDLGTSCSTVTRRVHPYNIINTSPNGLKCGYYALAIGVMQKDTGLRHAVYKKLGLTEKETDAIEECVTYGNFEIGQLLLGDKIFDFFDTGDGGKELLEKITQDYRDGQIRSQRDANIRERANVVAEAILLMGTSRKKEIFETFKGVEWREEEALMALEDRRQQESVKNKERKIEKNLKLLEDESFFKDYLSSKISDYMNFAKPNPIAEKLIDGALIRERANVVAEAILLMETSRKKEIFETFKGVEWREEEALMALEDRRQQESVENKERKIGKNLKLLEDESFFKDYLSSKISDYMNFAKPNPIAEKLIDGALKGSNFQSKRSDGKKNGCKQTEGEEWQNDDIEKAIRQEVLINSEQTFINVDRLKCMATILGLEVKVFPDKQTNGQNEICLIGPTSEERQNKKLVCIDNRRGQHYSAIEMNGVHESN